MAHAFILLTLPGERRPAFVAFQFEEHFKPQVSGIHKATGSDWRQFLKYCSTLECVLLIKGEDCTGKLKTEGFHISLLVPSKCVV